jgi:hypothetical protein
MATFYPSITPEQADLIQASRLFFVATADPALANGPLGEGPINASPKGGVPLHILSPNRVAFLDFAGSGNETGRHLSAGGPITVMVSSFDKEAAIVRLYGKGRVLSVDDCPYASKLLDAPNADLHLPNRQIIEIDIDQTMTSCGYGVPVMEFAQDRTRDDRGRRFK